MLKLACFGVFVSWKSRQLEIPPDQYTKTISTFETPSLTAHTYILLAVHTSMEELCQCFVLTDDKICCDMAKDNGDVSCVKLSIDGSKGLDKRCRLEFWRCCTALYGKKGNNKLPVKENRQKRNLGS